jgi:UMF1 family MFS transporter
MAKSNLWIWSFYDFANSLASIVVSFYFSLFLVNELHRSDLWLSIPVALATVMLFLTLPFLGSVTDKIKRYKPALYISSLLSIVVLILMAICCQEAKTNQLFLFPVVLFYFMFQYLCQAALAFYLPFIQDLAETNSRDTVASLGMAAGQLGNVVGLIVAFPIISSGANILGMTGTPLVFCTGAILFLLGLFFFNSRFKEENYDTSHSASFLPRSFKELFEHISVLKKERNVLQFLIAYHLFADAILTLQLFASLYLDKVGHLQPGLKTAGFAIGVFTGIIGAMCTPLIHKAVGNLKKALGICVIIWSGLLLLMALAQTPLQMVVILALNGFGFGSLFSLARIMYSKIIPIDEPAKYFGLFVIFERFASILGPLLWSCSAIIFAFVGEETKYRYAIGSLAALVLISFFVLRRVKEAYNT